MELWQIEYRDKRTGERKPYMNIGFESEQSAKNELERLKKAQKKYKNLDFTNSSFVPVAAIGSYWRVKKVKCKKA